LRVFQNVQPRNQKQFLLWAGLVSRHLQILTGKAVNNMKKAGLLNRPLSKLGQTTGGQALQIFALSLT
jgi:hypothetical protein